MKKIVSLSCKEKQVNSKVMVDGPHKYEMDQSKLGRFYILLRKIEEVRNGHYGFIDISNDGQFISYSIIDEISGIVFYANPSNFSEPFKRFLTECTDVALNRNSQSEVAHGA